MDIDVWEVVDAAKTKPFGFMPFYPGPGLGGHCIPIDPFYLSWKAREYDFHTEFIELSGKVNENMPYYVARRLMDALNNHEKSLCGSRVFLSRPQNDIDDLRKVAIKTPSCCWTRARRSSTTTRLSRSSWSPARRFPDVS
jgi:UDP-N-acetyl-D-glucosamine dehydrogenase